MVRKRNGSAQASILNPTAGVLQVTKPAVAVPGGYTLSRALRAALFCRAEKKNRRGAECKQSVFVLKHIPRSAVEIPLPSAVAAPFSFVLAAAPFCCRSQALLPVEKLGS